MNVILGENMEVLCLGCGSVMKKLYWRKSARGKLHDYLFTSWYGCTDCGKHIYDKHSDEYLQSSVQTARDQ